MPLLLILSMSMIQLRKLPNLALTTSAVYKIRIVSIILMVWQYKYRTHKIILVICTL